MVAVKYRKEVVGGRDGKVYGPGAELLEQNRLLQLEAETLREEMLPVEKILRSPPAPAQGRQSPRQKYLCSLFPGGIGHVSSPLPAKSTQGRWAHNS